MSFNESYIPDHNDATNGTHKFSIDDSMPAPPEDNKDEDEVQLKEQKRRDQSPLWNCTLVVRAPELAFGVMLFLHLAGAAVMFLLLLGGYDILPTDVGQIYLDVRHNDDFLQGLAWKRRNEGDDIIHRIEYQDERTEVASGLEFYFECKGCNVLTAKNMKKNGGNRNEISGRSRIPRKILLPCGRYYNRRFRGSNLRLQMFSTEFNSTFI